MPKGDLLTVLPIFIRQEPVNNQLHLAWAGQKWRLTGQVIRRSDLHFYYRPERAFQTLPEAGWLDGDGVPAQTRAWARCNTYPRGLAAARFSDNSAGSVRLVTACYRQQHNLQRQAQLVWRHQ